MIKSVPLKPTKIENILFNPIFYIQNKVRINSNKKWAHKNKHVASAKVIWLNEIKNKVKPKKKKK